MNELLSLARKGDIKEFVDFIDQTDVDINDVNTTFVSLF